MGYPCTKYNCHDAQLTAFHIGPRNEITLEIRLDKAWNENAPEFYSLRFGAIDNMNEVTCFFTSLEKPEYWDNFGLLGGVDYLHKDQWIVSFEFGIIKIRSGKLTESEGKSTKPLLDPIG
jgi:hypothetical protein